MTLAEEAQDLQKDGSQVRRSEYLDEKAVPLYQPRSRQDSPSSSHQHSTLPGSTDQRDFQENLNNISEMRGESMRNGSGSGSRQRVGSQTAQSNESHAIGVGSENGNRGRRWDDPPPEDMFSTLSISGEGGDRSNHDHRRHQGQGQGQMSPVTSSRFQPSPPQGQSNLSANGIQDQGQSNFSANGIQDRDLNASPAGDLITDARAAEGQRYQQAMLAECAAGNHQYRRQYGIGGIASLIIIFPLSPLFLYLDHQKICTRCGAKGERFRAPDKLQEKYQKMKAGKKKEVLADREGIDDDYAASGSNRRIEDFQSSNGNFIDSLKARRDEKDSGDFDSSSSKKKEKRSSVDSRPQAAREETLEEVRGQDGRLKRRNSGRFEDWNREGGKSV